MHVVGAESSTGMLSFTMKHKMFYRGGQKVVAGNARLGISSLRLPPQNLKNLWSRRLFFIPLIRGRGLQENNGMRMPTLRWGAGSPHARRTDARE